MSTRASGESAAWPALAKLRIGCVQYLNAKPLIHGYDGPVVFDHTSALARDLSRGELDVALVPIFEALRDPRYLIADGVAIASDGPVYSVFLAHRGPLAEVRTIALDPASLTSVHLLQVLLAEYHGLRPQCVDTSAMGGRGSRRADAEIIAAEARQEPRPPIADAELLIGNQAIDFRHEHTGTHQFLDLGAEWKRCTGLPFVYAPWLIREDLPKARAAADELRALGRAGVACIDKIVGTETFHDADFRRRYLTQHIRFALGEREKAGIAKFRELLEKHGFIAPDARALVYV